MSDTPFIAHRSPADALNIDQICDRFEAAWMSGSRPTLEEYIAAVDEQCRLALLRELLLLDWHYRHQAGEFPKPAEYLARFPDARSVIDDVAAEMTDSAAPTLHRSGNNATPPTPPR